MSATTIELVHLLAPRVLERARRLEVAVQLLAAGQHRREVSGIIQRRFGISQQVAWKIVDMAADMAGERKP